MKAQPILTVSDATVEFIDDWRKAASRSLALGSVNILWDTNHLDDDGHPWIAVRINGTTVDCVVDSVVCTRSGSIEATVFEAFRTEEILRSGDSSEIDGCWRCYIVAMNDSGGDVQQKVIIQSDPDEDAEYPETHQLLTALL